MAQVTTNATSAPLYAGILRVISAIGASFVAMGEANRYVRQIEALQALSDAELAERGLRRDQIVHYVFKDAHFA